jgi:hypothetical protein
MISDASSTEDERTLTVRVESARERGYFFTAFVPRGRSSLMIGKKHPNRAVEAAYVHYLREAKDIAALHAANNALEWDMETGMPAAGGDARAEVIAAIAGFAHEKATAPGYGEDLALLAETAGKGELDEKYAIIVRKAWRAYERDRKLPKEMVERHSALFANAHPVWVAAKDANDWERFLPFLSRIVDAKREEASAVGYAASPYDALLDEYEPGMTTAQAEAMLGGLAPALADRPNAGSPRTSRSNASAIAASRPRSATTSPPDASTRARTRSRRRSIPATCASPRATTRATCSTGS